MTMPAHSVAAERGRQGAISFYNPRQDPPPVTSDI
jgi:hypothetical protein